MPLLEDGWLAGRENMSGLVYHTNMQLPTAQNMVYLKIVWSILCKRSKGLRCMAGMSFEVFNIMRAVFKIEVMRYLRHRHIGIQQKAFGLVDDIF